MCAAPWLFICGLQAQLQASPVQVPGLGELSSLGSDCERVWHVKGAGLHLFGDADACWSAIVRKLAEEAMVSSRYSTGGR